jgi:SulP family sulfate permease
MINKWFPFLKWEFSRQSVRADLVAGLTVALVLIPQSMAYAQLAGLPVVVGLYASFLPVIFGALWGCSHHLQTGPVAMTSLLTATALLPLAAPETAEYVLLAGVLAVLLGVIRLLIGFFRLTEIANFLSKPVMDGFVHAGVLVIASSQISKLFGLQMGRSSWYLRDLWNLVLDLPHTNRFALLLGAGSVLLLVGLKRFAPRLPAALFVVAGSTGLVYAFGLSDPARVSTPVSVVGEIPLGLPSFKAVHLDGALLLKMIPGALAITFIGFMEMCGVAKAVAAKSKQSLNLDQEMIGQGLAAISAGVTGGYPISGSFSRTALNFSAGAKTGLSSVFTGLIVAVFLMFMAGMLYYLPKAALGAIIIVAVVKLLDFRQLFSYWKISRVEGFTAVFTFVATLCFAPQLQNGILAGAALSIFFYLFSSMKPNVSLFACRPDGTCDEAAADQLADVPFPVLRFDGRLFFANTSYFEEAVLNLQGACPSARFIGIDARGINAIDVSGVERLEALIVELRENGVELVFCGLKPAVTRVLERAGVMAQLGEQNLFPGLNSAQKFVFSDAAAAG